MVFTETKLKGVYTIEMEPIEDKRGFFARTFCQNEFVKHGLSSHIVQSNISFNKKKGILRGMHYQSSPYEETKLVSCIGGAIYDVVVDLRKESKTYCQSVGLELSAQDFKQLYIPFGCAHGFLTLGDHTTVFYQMSEFYHPECAKGVRWDDPLFDIKWPQTDLIISDKDMNYPQFIK